MTGHSDTGIPIRPTPTYDPVAEASVFVPFTTIAVATDLVVGTTYRFDLQVAAVTGGTASLVNVGCAAWEI